MAFFNSDQSLTVVIKAKNEASGVFKDVEKSMGKVSARAKKMQPAFKKMAIVGTAAFAAIAVGATKAINKARDFEEETNKFKVVFKEVAKEAQDMADTLNRSYGLSRLESKRLLAATGDILTGFGFTGQGALDLSSKVNTLAVDLASFTNAQGGAEAVSNALTKALLGERESLKTYGIAIQQADIDARLLEKGMDGLTGAARRQAIAEETLAIAYEQSKNAVGDYERSVGTLKNTQIELAKTIEDIQIAIGTELAPILNDILQEILPIIKSLEKWIRDNPQLTKLVIIFTGALAGLLAVIGFIGLALPAIITGITALAAVILSAAGLVGIMVVAILGLSFMFVNLLSKWNFLNKNFFIPLGQALMGTRSLVDMLTGGFRELIAIIGEALAAVGRFTSGKLGGALGAVGGIFGKIFEHGGRVPGARGQPVPIIAHGQEQIIPANQARSGGGAGINVTINNPIFTREEDEARMKQVLDNYFRPLLINHKLTA